MNYEKAYKEALEKIREGLHPLPDGTKISGVTRAFLEEVFPELKESEDERIRKELIESFKYQQRETRTDKEWLNGIKLSEVVAWLEKQGEQKPIMNVPPRDVILSIWDLGNEWKELTNGRISTEYGTTLDYIQKHWHESEYYLREKQGEKKPIEMKSPEESLGVSSKEYNEIVNECLYSESKPTDKVEPKFHEGDFVVSKITNTTYQIESVVLNVTNNKYGYDLTNGGYIASIEAYKYHLWTIEDAKPGDVLYHSDSASNGIFIFKELLEYEFGKKVICYCDYDSEDGFCLGESHTCCWADAKILHPATKEQRDLLFKKIEEAGYEWDAEKKELKKINSYCQENCKGYQEIGKCFVDGGCDTKRKAEQKPAWSEEDEKMYRMCVDAVEYYHTSEDESVIRDWLISLKERLS